MASREQVEAFLANLKKERQGKFELVFDIRPYLIKVPCGKYGDTFNYKVGPEVVDWCDVHGFDMSCSTENGEYEVTKFYFPSKDLAALFKLRFGGK